MATAPALRDVAKAAVSAENLALLMWLQTESRHPTTKPLDFNACFGGNLTHEARDLLNLATAQRSKLIEVLGTSVDTASPDPRNVSAAVEAYLPSLWTITASLEAASTLTIKLTPVKLMFAWTSSLMEKPKEMAFGVLMFEVCFCLAIRALAHRQTARVILEANPAAYMEASNELRCAAGIFELIANGLLPRWNSPPATRPPEVFSQVAACFAAMCLADAQRIVAAKSIATDASPSVVARLLLGAEEKYLFATRALQALDQTTFNGVGMLVKEELGALPPLCRALAMSELAFVSHSKEEYGKAACFAREAARRLGALNALGKNLVQAGLAKLVAEARGRAELLAKEYENEATACYFVTIPGPNDLVLPDSSFIVKAIAYSLPEANLVSFSEVPLPPGMAKTPRGFFASLFSSSQDFYTAEELQALEKLKLQGPQPEAAEAAKETPL